MKIMLIGINAKYSHTALAIDYIYEACQGLDVHKLEFNINQKIEHIYGEILKQDADIIAFSTYIWNLEMVQKLTSDLAMTSDAVLIWGGPEASFDVDEHFAENPGLDIIVKGEGEVTDRELFETLERGGDLSQVEGIAYREAGAIHSNPDRMLIRDLDSIPSPFINLQSDPGKMVYFEMSRGCPFHCAYCLSSTIKGVRHFSFERITSDLDHIMRSGTKVVKLVDRTFNANEAFSMKVMDYIVEHSPREMVFHMELMAHLISDAFLDYLSTLPHGLFQFEIGIQSSNLQTLDAIDRRTDLDRLSTVVKRIRSFGTIHQHVDLIVGLPFEDYTSFQQSFDFAYRLGAEKLQMGFLKVLRGSNILSCVEEHEIQYSTYPPYEVKSTKYLSADEIRRLKIIEDLVDAFVNEDHFEHTLAYVLKGKSPFAFFEHFSLWWEDHDYHTVNHARKRLYTYLHTYLSDHADIEEITERLKLDHFIHEPSMPDAPLEPIMVERARYRDLLDDTSVRERFGHDATVSTTTLLKRFAFGAFKLSNECRIYGVDYKQRRACDITDDYQRILAQLPH